MVYSASIIFPGFSFSFGFLYFLSFYPLFFFLLSLLPLSVSLSSTHGTFYIFFILFSCVCFISLLRPFFLLLAVSLYFTSRPYFPQVHFIFPFMFHFPPFRSPHLPGRFITLHTHHLIFASLHFTSTPRFHKFIFFPLHVLFLSFPLSASSWAFH